MIARHRLALSLSALLSLAAACGDDDGGDDDSSGSAADAGDGDGGDDDGDGDGDGDADAGPGTDGGDPGGATAFAVATDFATTGVASTVSIPELDVTVNAIEGVATTDPVVRHQGDRLFVVNRFGQDNVTVLDSARLTLVDQLSTGAGSNPQDAAAVGDTLFVAALGEPGILVLDLARPEAGVVDVIDLAQLDAEDGNPDCSSVVALGEQVVAVCGILDENLAPRGPGAVALIDGARRALVQTAPLTQVRPFGLAQASADESTVLIPTIEDFARPAGPGCLERVVVGEDSLRAAGCLVENADLGGFVSALATVPDGLWMTVTTSFDPDDLGPYGDLVSLPAGGKPDRIELADDLRPMDLAICPSGHVVLSDATRGVRVLAPGAERELTRGPLDIGLPPVSNGLACY
jgi:hypothetical protein